MQKRIRRGASTVGRAWRNAPSNVAWGARQAGKFAKRKFITEPLKREKAFREQSVIESLGADTNPKHPYWDK